MKPASILLPAFSLALALSALAQDKRTLQPTDYAQWESIRSAAISNDGHWFAYSIGVVDGDGWTVVRNVDTPQKWMTAMGAIPVFSDDSKWVAYAITPSKRESDALKEQKKPIENRLGLRNLEDGGEVILESVESFRFLKGSKFLIAKRNRGAAKAEGGSDLFITNLKDGTSVTLGNVGGYTLNKAETLLALDVESDSKNNGVQIYNPESQKLTTVLWGKDNVSNLAWAEDTDTVAFLRGTPNEKKEGDWNTVVLAKNASTKPEVSGFNAEQLGKQGKRIAEFGGLTISPDGSAVAFGVRDWADKKGKQGKPEEKAGVDVWHWKDLDVLPRQRIMLPGETRRTMLHVWHPADNSVVQVTDDKARNGFLLNGLRSAVIFDSTPYRSAVTNGLNYQDIYLVNLADGKRTQVLKKTQWGAIPSRKGKYLAYFKDMNWWVYDIAAGTSVNVTNGLAKHFENVEDDHTVPEKPAADSPTWLADDRGLIVGNRYDHWLVALPGGKATRMTGGEKDAIKFTDLDPYHQEDGMRADQPMYFSAIDENTKKAGFYVWRPSSGGKMLVFDDKSFGSLAKAKDAGRMIFSFGSYADSPNVYVTNGNFDQSKALTHTNPQQDKYLWGRTQLVSYKTTWGKLLHGFLIYPADYKPGKKYPMVTYIYEKLSDEVNNYVGPVDWSSYNVQVLSQNGYFVFKPDLAYRGRNPGLSAVQSIEPAVDAALKAQPDIDPRKVGLMGHSWGGYQTAFIITQSKKFAAAVAGAPLTDLKSMYLSYYTNSGTPDSELLETGQGRLAVPWWIDPKTYEANSPIYHIQNITAPLLLAQGTADGAVDFHQGMYMYTAMRRMGKNVIFLTYEGENHNFTKRPNQLDYAKRLRHFFDVYLKGAKPEPWITDGVPLISKDG